MMRSFFKWHRLPCLAAGLILGGCAGQEAPEARVAAPPMAVDTTTRESEVESQISAGWPFPVEVTVLRIVDYPPEFVSEIRGQFLEPLARSPQVGRIAKVEIRADSSDWSQWTCIVQPRGGAPEIRIEGDHAFRDGRVTQSPYRRAVRVVLDELSR